MEAKRGGRTRKTARYAIELAEIHGNKPEKTNLQVSTITLPKSKSYPAKESILKNSLQETELSCPYKIKEVSETSCFEKENDQATEREGFLESERKSYENPSPYTSQLLRKTNVLQDSRTKEKKFPHMMDEHYYGQMFLHPVNLMNDAPAIESDRSYSPSSASAKSSTSNIYQLTPNLKYPRKLHLDSHISTEKKSSGSDTEQSDSGIPLNESKSKTKLHRKKSLFRIGSMKKEEPSQEIPQFSKEYMSDKEVKRREFEVKGLLNKKSDTQATSLEAVQRSKPKPKIKRSISMLPRKRAPRGLRRQSDVVVPTIRIDDYFVSKPDAATDKLQNNGHTSKRKPSFGFLDILMPLHSPKFTKHRGHKKSKSSDVLESELSESGASDINLLDTDTFLEKKFKETAGKELRKFYSYFSVPLPSPWMKKQIKISDIFVEPILSFNRKAVPLEKLFVVQPNRSTKNPLIVIKGQPGAGKTALCQYLVHSWCQNEARVVELDSIELLFMIECKFVTPNLMSSLRTIYLKESISLLPRAEADNEYLFKVINKFKTLIILDGFDEIQDSSRSLLEKIRTELPDAKVIVSTRLSGIRDIQETLELDISYDAVEFLLQLFDDDQLVSLVLNISHIYDISDEDQIKLLDHVDDNDELRQVLQVPLHLILYLMLWIHEPIIFKNMKTVIDVFDGVISLMCNQLCTCIEMKSGQPLLTLQVVKSLLNEVGHLCLQCIQGRQFYFTPREYHSLKHYCDTVGINLHNALKIMMHEVTYLSGRNLKTFCHVTVMEHLAATFMDDNIITNVTGIFEILTPNKGANSGPVNCWKSCASITSTPTATVTNSGTRNYQLDSAISHLAQISCKNDHHTFKMGKELATYFSLNNNRNLITLSNIISPLQTREHPFKHGLKKGLSNQNLPDQIHIWNLKHVINLIEYGALKPSVQVKFTVENSKEWGTIVNKLVNLGCKPYINVVLEDVDQMKALVCALGVIKNPSVPKLILHFGFVEIGINDLVASWPYPKTMHMVSPKGKYAIESYLACILLVEAMGKNRVKYIKFTGHESSYIFGLLKTSLSGVSIQLQPYARDCVQFEIFMKF